tara:strand:+ start:6264 stop:6788 length:525 start_codon:yes stop_codon:yes gene_type:complete
MDDLKVMQRGKFYLTPLQYNHVEEICSNLPPEGLHDIYCLGYDSPKEAILEMMENSEVYIVKSKDGPILCVTGLVFDNTIEWPQFFCIFTNEVKENLRLLVIGSRMVIRFFDKTHPQLCMSISSDFPIMLNWAASLGFEAVGFSEATDCKYIDFVRCNPIGKSVSHKSSRPVMH